MLDAAVRLTTWPMQTGSLTVRSPVGTGLTRQEQDESRFRPVPLPQLIEAVNWEVLIVAMLESPAALENPAAIVAVPGIDVLLMGGNDLATEMGFLAGAQARTGFLRGLGAAAA